MNKRIYLSCLILFSVCFHGVAQKNQLRNQIKQVIAHKKADVGVSVYGIESKDTISVNGDRHYPMQSVFKFHIAMAVLNQVDKGKFSLSQTIHIKKSDLLPDTWSPIRDAHPNGEVDLPLAEIIKYTVAQSDNNGCDILMRLLGGPKPINDYIHSLGVKDVAIKANEEEMHKEWNVQFSNWSTPKAITELLVKFYTKNLLSKESFNFLWTTMVETSTGVNRIKGQLPKGTVVGHKTGTSGTSKAGITAAINDMGIVRLPNGKHYAIAVFVCNTKENEATNDKIISEISKLVWDYNTHKSK
ncbi:class A beta-lactamase, subclass A2 [Pedobacter sp. N36a]|uniref:class A beta-lactamase, subclass A2 n=1 Tax=Pedobacter sp. N36a TaxID=2767996 RepID=UPI00165725CD|nr:class A beta-lactamase, subclass A2 [Pedobacter sp. N36a]MBC8985396.1 class A beta-lactamase, subclass A2 [Pedobacter sp. N36a]